MAIQLKSINKRSDSLYTVTVEDTGQVIGIDESGGNIYRTYSVKYNPINGRDDLRTSIERLIQAEKVESIDPMQIQVRAI